MSDDFTVLYEQGSTPLMQRVKEMGGIEKFNQIVEGHSNISKMALNILKECGVQIYLDEQKQAEIAPQILWLTFHAQTKLANTLFRKD